MTVFKLLEADPTHAPAVEGMSAEWKRCQEEKPSDLLPHRSSDVSQSSETQIGVVISTSGRRKSHNTIWGRTVNNLRDIRSAPARRVFEIIRQISGITRITLGRCNREFRSACGATVSESTTPCAIDGKLFDPTGRKGTMQSFQVWVQFDSYKERVCTDIIAKLKEMNYWTE